MYEPFVHHNIHLHVYESYTYESFVPPSLTSLYLVRIVPFFICTNRTLLHCTIRTMRIINFPCLSIISTPFYQYDSYMYESCTGLVRFVHTIRTVRIVHFYLANSSVRFALYESYPTLSQILHVIISQYESYPVFVRIVQPDFVPSTKLWSLLAAAVGFSC